MADFAPNYTARLKLTYSTFGDIHTCGLRYDASMAQSAVVTAGKALLNDIFAAMTGKMTITATVLDLEYSAANSTFFAPVSTTGLVIGGTVNAGVVPMDEIVTTTWSGRSLGGHKGKFVLYGLVWGVADPDFDDFVVTSAEEAFIATVQGLLASAGSIDGLVMNDNLDAVFWRARATIKPNDAWAKNRRP